MMNRENRYKMPSDREAEEDREWEAWFKTTRVFSVIVITIVIAILLAAFAALGLGIWAIGDYMGLWERMF